MHDTLIIVSTVIAVALIHLSYVDFRFRYRDGILWFWLLNPAPPLMWLGRVTVIAALITALCGPFIGINETYGFVLGGTMLVHLISLVLLEVLEPR
jgi:hypothetical protein